MSSFWQRGSCQQRGRLTLLLALFLFPLASWAGPYGELDARLRGRPDREAVAALRSLAGEDPDALAALQSGPRAARAYIGLRATLEGAAPVKPPPIAKAQGDERIASSWLGRALSRLRAPKIDMPDMPSGSVGGVGPWATVLMWGLLALLGGFAVYLLFRFVRFPAMGRKAKPIAPDEPIRSADAWLEEANALIAQGRYREAVRGLYVAGLMRLDEAGVARFDPHQTNWEHLRRIEASPKRPEGSDVRAATGLFDRCWYGHVASTSENATTMRAWYDGLVSRLAEAKR